MALPVRSSAVAHDPREPQSLAHNVEEEMVDALGLEPRTR